MTKPRINFYLRGNDLMTLSSHPSFLQAWTYNDYAPDEYGKIEHQNFWGIYHINNEPIGKGNISRWIRYPTSKPSGDRLCYTFHSGSSARPVICSYRKSDDVFHLDGPGNSSMPPISVTHFIELPFVYEVK